MQELIEAIRVAVASDASHDQKASGVQACRTILAALDTEPGKPIALPGISAPGSASRVSVDQVLDLMIGRLATMAAERDAYAAPPAPEARGLRVPLTPVTLPRPAASPAAHMKRPITSPRKR